MKCYEIGAQDGLQALRLVQRPAPVPGPGQAVLRTRAACLNHRDLKLLQGSYGPRRPETRIPGSDGVGDVVAVGDGVPAETHLELTVSRPGYRTLVVGPETLWSSACAHEFNPTRCPENLRTITADADYYARGQSIITAGHASDELFVITAGSAMVSIPTQDGVARLDALTGGMSFGEIAFLDRSPRSANVTALSPLECRVLTRAAFAQLGSDAPQIKIRLLENIALGLTRLVGVLVRDDRVFVARDRVAEGQGDLHPVRQLARERDEGHHPGRLQHDRGEHSRLRRRQGRPERRKRQRR